MKEKWYNEAAANEPVAISTRIRLARNLKDAAFPRLLDSIQKREVAEKVLDGFKTAFAERVDEFDIIDMGKLKEEAAYSLVERRLVSQEFAAAGEGGFLILSKDHSVSIMLNEEDHVRIQVLASGLQLENAYTMANQIDDMLNARLEFAYDARLGYLTECPTNLGTGLRASVMLHLPAMLASGSVGRLAETVSRLGFTVRGAYGEGSEVRGGFFQISNQITLGISETNAIDNLSTVVKQIIATEEDERKRLIVQPEVQDRMWRSLGVLRTARLLSGDETVELASNLRLGMACGVFKGEKIDPSAPGKLIALTGPATLTVQSGRKLSAHERDTLRAQTVRSIMNDK